LSHLLAAAGVLLAAGAAAAAILLPPGRARAAAMLLALALFPTLILGDQWHSRQIADLRESAAGFIGLGVLAVIAAAVLAAAFTRWRLLQPLAIVFTLPFRIPLHAGGDTANLLVPLYLVIAGGVLATAWRAFGPAGAFETSSTFPGKPEDPRAGGAVGGPAPEEASATAGGGGSPAATGPARRGAWWLPKVLAAVVALYAMQTLYSPDFSKSLQNVCFFFVPFSLVYALLRDVDWSRKLLRLVLWVVGLEALAFVLVGSVEWAVGELFWNNQVIRSNEFHTYFRVNSIFWDPNIYGRYLALVMVAAMAALLWARERRDLALLSALLAALWFGLVPTYSQSSFAALLAGLGMLAALRWSWRWTQGAVAVLALLGVAVVLCAGGSSKLSPDRLNVDTGGRANLVSGGADLFAHRPLWGYGAGSFPRAYREHVATKKVPVSVSHTEPITVAAEQGVIGLVAYAALLAVAIWTMASGLFASRAGPARQAVLAAFVALLVHTMAYAGFFEDPISWVLMSVGASLAAIRRLRPEA
jgi:O-antigen ligase